MCANNSSEEVNEIVRECFVESFRVSESVLLNHFVCCHCQFKHFPNLKLFSTIDTLIILFAYFHWIKCRSLT